MAKKLKSIMKRLLYILPGVLAIGSTLVVVFLNDFRLKEEFNQQFSEKQAQVELLAHEIDSFVERDNDWGTYDYETDLRISVEFIDSQHMTFAAGYDENLNNIATRHKSEATEFNPLNYSEFIESVTSNESGVMNLWWEEDNVQGRDMRLYFRWIPTDANLSGRFLVAVAISKLSITHVDMTLIAIVLGFVSLGINYGMIGYLGWYKREHGNR